MVPHYPPRKKRQEFFVDTESTCFLCLHQITPDTCDRTRIGFSQNDDDDIVQMNMLEQHYAKKKKETLSLRSIFKLLGMDGGKVLSKELTAGPFHGSNLVNTDFSVVLCKTCRQITTQLTNLFSKWEVIQMKMDNAVQHFADILEHSERDPNLMVQMQEKLIDPLAQLQGSVAQVLRNETLKRCCGHLQKSWPKVTLYRTNKSASTGTTRASSVAFVTPSPNIPSTFVSGVQDEFPSDDEVEHETCALPKPTTCKDCGRKFTNSKGIHLHRKLYCKFRPQVQHPAPGADQQDTTTTAANINELLGSMPRIKMEDEQDFYVLCALCPSPNTSHKFTEPDLKKHIIADHSDYFFASVKRLGYSAVKFQKLCKKIVQDELFACQTNHVDGGSDVANSTYNCCHCRNMYPEEFDTFSHLVQDHYSIYACKLKDLQCGTTEISATGIIGRPNSIDAQWRCDICGKTLASKKSLRRHKKVSCSNDTSQSRPNAGKGLFRCDACGNNLANEKVLRRHKKYYCSKSPRATLNVRDEPCSCDTCGKKFAYKRYLRYHKKYSCTKFSQATPNSGDDSLRCDACGKMLSHKNSLWRHKKLYCHKRRQGDPNSEKDSLNCDACGRKFAYESYLRLHKKHYCSKGGKGAPKSKEDSCHCDTCGKKFSDTSSLRRHRTNHCPEASQQSTATDTIYVKDEDEEEMPMELSSVVVDTKIEELEPLDEQDVDETSSESATMKTQERLMLDDLVEV